MSQACHNLALLIKGVPEFIFLLVNDIWVTALTIIMGLYQGHLPIFIPESLPAHFLSRLTTLGRFILQVFWALYSFIIYLLKYLIY